jgi:hypothetical protein
VPPDLEAANSRVGARVDPQRDLSSVDSRREARRRRGAPEVVERVADELLQPRICRERPADSIRVERIERPRELLRSSREYAGA